MVIGGMVSLLGSGWMTRILSTRTIIMLSVGSVAPVIILAGMLLVATGYEVLGLVLLGMVGLTTSLGFMAGLWIVRSLIGWQLKRRRNIWGQSK